MNTDPEALRMMGIQPKGVEVSGTKEAAALNAAAENLGEQTEHARQAAAELQAATMSMRNQTDLQAARLSSNHTTPRMESLRGGEG